MTRRLKHDDLIASDAGPPICQPARRSGAERDRTVAKIEHDKVVAEPMHLAEGDPAHSAAYMAGGTAQSNKSPAIKMPANKPECPADVG